MENERGSYTAVRRANFHGCAEKSKIKKVGRETGRVRTWCTGLYFRSHLNVDYTKGPVQAFPESSASRSKVPSVVQEQSDDMLTLRIVNSNVKSEIFCQGMFILKLIFCFFNPSALFPCGYSTYMKDPERPRVSWKGKEDAGCFGH